MKTAHNTILQDIANGDTITSETAYQRFTAGRNIAIWPASIDWANPDEERGDIINEASMGDGTMEEMWGYLLNSYREAWGTDNFVFGLA